MRERASANRLVVGKLRDDLVDSVIWYKLIERDLIKREH